MMKAILGQILEIQVEQNEIIRSIANEEKQHQFWTTSIEHSSHLRDHHGCPWDTELTIMEQRTAAKKIDKLNQKYKQNNERLKQLQQQLFAAVL
jgi:hypothetical protein